MKQIKINGAELNYTDHGSGEPVVFVHGVLEDYRTWEAQADRFSKNYRVITYSRRFNFPNKNSKLTDKTYLDNTRVYRMSFAGVYPHYIKKAEKKGRTKEEVDAIIFWLTGYDKKTLLQQIDRKIDFETFFAQAPQLNPDVTKITGVICGYRVEDIEDKLMQKIRYLDKLIDELAKGKTMEKILRK